MQNSSRATCSSTLAWLRRQSAATAAHSANRISSSSPTVLTLFSKELTPCRGPTTTQIGQRLTSRSLSDGGSAWPNVTVQRRSLKIAKSLTKYHPRIGYTYMPGTKARVQGANGGY